jgi:hypothetical protein
MEESSVLGTESRTFAPISGALARLLARPAVLVLAFVLAGSIFRIGQYLSQRSFWHDEAFLVLNIQDKTARGLLGRLEHDQAAPPLFLLAQKGLVSWLGQSEYVYRTLPVAFGVGGLVLFGGLALRVMPQAAPWAVALMAFSDKLIWHSSEAKQYSSDVFVAVLMLYIAAGRPGMSAMARLTIAAALATAGMWFSHAAIFMFGGVSLALLPRILREGRWRIAVYAALNATVLASFVLLYWFSIRLQQTQYLREYWSDRFPDWSRPLLVPWWLVRQVFEFGNHPYESLGWLMVLLAGAGGVLLYRTNRLQLLGSCLAPIGLVIVAACVQKYPFGGSRVTVFLLPGVCMLAAAGVEQLRLHLGKEHRRWWWVAIVPFLGMGLVQGTYHLFSPRTKSHIRPVAAYVRERRQADEAIYVMDGRRANRSLEMFCYWRPEGPVYTDRRPRGAIATERFWIVAAIEPGDFEHLSPILKYVASVARERGRYEVRGGIALLFEKRAKRVHGAGGNG